jgi:hypothetical protein
MSLTDIKNAIRALSEKERCELNAWLQNWEPDDWNRQMEGDAQSGKFDAMVRETVRPSFGCESAPTKEHNEI